MGLALQGVVHWICQVAVSVLGSRCVGDRATGLQGSRLGR